MAPAEAGEQEEAEVDAEWGYGKNDEWPDPDPSPPMAEQAVEWLKKSTKTFLNLFGGYVFLIFGWLAFFVAAFYFSFFLVGVNQAGGNAGVWVVMRIGAQTVMSSIQPMSDAMAGFIGSISLVMFAGGVISLWAYRKLKKIGGMAWERLVSWVR